MNECVGNHGLPLIYNFLRVPGTNQNPGLWVKNKTVLSSEWRVQTQRKAGMIVGVGTIEKPVEI